LFEVKFDYVRRSNKMHTFFINDLIQLYCLQIKFGYTVDKFLCDFTVLDPVWVFVVAVGTSIADNTSYFNVN